MNFYSKGSLFFSERLVSNAGLSPLPEKKKKKKPEALKIFPLPETMEESRRFLAVVNFYRKFLKNVSALQAPLYELLKKEC